MQTIKGKYKNGHIRLSRKPKVTKEVDVTVLFPPSPQAAGLTRKQNKKLLGLISLGGNALEDTERLYS